ncbi:MAG: glycosyltransferase family 39 protein [bacterium]|nr:glycosyltransferase family 39 protein [bacterium]
MNRLKAVFFKNKIAKIFLKRICTLLGVGLFCFFIYSLWQPYFYDPPLIVDEAFYGETALRFLDGDFAYRDNKPPGIFLLYASFASVFGAHSYTFVHICACLTVIATSIVLYFAMRIFSGTLTAFLGFVFYLLLPVLSFSPANFFAANTEIFLMFFSCLSLLIFLKSESNKIGLFISGILCAFGFLFKPQGILTGTLLCGFHSYRLLTQSIFSIKRTFFELSVIIGGFIAGLVPCVLFFGKHLGFDMLFYNIFGANASFFTGDIDIVNGFIFGFKKTLNLLEYSTHWDRKALFYAIALLQFCIFCISLFRKHISKNDSHKTAVFWIAWSIVSFISLSAGFRFSGHYFYMVYPAIAGLCAFFWTGIIKQCCSVEIHPFCARIILTGCSVILFTGMIAYPLFFYTGFPFGTKRLYSYLLLPESSGETLRMASYYLNAHTKPSDTLFVWGFAPEVYALSRRRCASRYVICNYLVGDVSPFLKGVKRDTATQRFWQELFSDLLANQPQYIIDTAPLNYLGFGTHPLEAYPELLQYIKKQYSLDKEIGTLKLYRRKQ